MELRRAAAVVALAVAVTLAPPSVARADAAGPTDYESTVVSVEPATDAVDVSIVGGDSFVELAVAPGSEVIVTGYEGEPFLRFRADGAVEENGRSPTVYLSRSRLGGDDVPAYADSALPPSWRPVGSGGRYAWHDHRAHWMSADRPLGASPGDVVAEGVIPLQVDGAAVAVSVTTHWLPSPSPLAGYLGAGVAAVAVIGTVTLRRRVAWPVLAGALAAAGAGWWQYHSLPAETDPLIVWWLLPVLAAAAALVALVLGRRLTAAALVLLAGLFLGGWVAQRRDGLTRPVLPTDAPFWLDRAVTAAAAVMAAVAVVAGLLGLFRASVRA